MISSQISSFFLPLFYKHKKIFLLLGLDGIISGGVAVVMPIFLKLETDQLVDQHGKAILGINLDGFSVFLAILGLIIIVQISTRIISSISQIITTAEKDYFENDIQLNLFSYMDRMEVGRTMNSRFKNIGRILDREFPEFAEQILRFPGGLLQRSIEIIGLTAVFAYFDIRLLIIVIISSVLSYSISTYAEKIRKKYDIQWQMTLGNKTYQYGDLFLREFINLATNGAVRSTLKNYKDLLDSQIQSGLRKNWTDLTWTISGLFTGTVSEMMIKGIVGYAVFVGTSSVGMVALVVSSMDTVRNIISSMIDISQQYRTFRFRESSILLFLRICEPISTGRSDITIGDQIDHIGIHDLTFSYPNLASYERDYLSICQTYLGSGGSRDRNWINEKMAELIENIEEDTKQESPVILNEINLTLEKGRIYGIVGKNGAGKTTLMHLLAGFFRSYTGEIFLGTYPTRDWEPSVFASHISFLTQSPYIMHWGSTLKENLMLGVSVGITDETIWEYLDKFGIGEKVRKAKNQLNADMGDDIEFSGGEKQIIAFIRVLLQDRDIVIMDEGTNQLDAENEVLVMSELMIKKSNKIIIFITHRMSTISRADMIYCLEGGQISARGSHRELLIQGTNTYARFYRAQVLHDGVV